MQIKTNSQAVEEIYTEYYNAETLNDLQFWQNELQQHCSFCPENEWAYESWCIELDYITEQIKKLKKVEE